MLRGVINGTMNIQSALVIVAALIVAFTVHEFCHGFAAYMLGDKTAKHDGRLSFNPLVHIDPLGMVMILVAGFGWAKPVMVNPYHLRNPKYDMAIISIAGPASNFILGFVALLINAFLIFVFRINFAGAFYLTFFLAVLFEINVFLGLFNMIPLPPLDGSKLLSIFLPDHLYFRFISFRHGFIVLILLVFTGAIGMILNPFHSAIFNGYQFIIVRLVSPFM
ncbi:MAG: site-2 protease family protein [Defluviitaleaceae bacterium]|nr:site-2 protease family protein [Defluviitaleaceae bacterium]